MSSSQGCRCLLVGPHPGHVSRSSDRASNSRTRGRVSSRRRRRRAHARRRTSAPALPRRGHRGIDRVSLGDALGGTLAASPSSASLHQPIVPSTVCPRDATNITVLRALHEIFLNGSSDVQLSSAYVRHSVRTAWKVCCQPPIIVSRPQDINSKAGSTARQVPQPIAQATITMAARPSAPPRASTAHIDASRALCPAPTADRARRLGYIHRRHPRCDRWRHRYPRWWILASRLGPRCSTKWSPRSQGHKRYRSAT